MKKKIKKDGLTVIFRKRTKNSKSGTVKTVSTGFFMNYLKPNKIAELYTNQEVIHNNLEVKEYDISENTIIPINRESNNLKVLYGSVSKNDLIKELEKIGVVGCNRNNLFFEPIKTLGRYPVEMIINDYNYKFQIEVIDKTKEERNE